MQKEDLNKKIGEHIIRLRKEKGWTQSDLSKACFKDRQSIERLEKGRTNPTLYTLYEVGRAMNVSMKKLMDFY